MMEKERAMGRGTMKEVTCQGTTFYFTTKTEKNGKTYIDLTTDGHPPDSPQAHMLKRVEDFLRANQTQDDREIDAITLNRQFLKF
jgi:hypothetical protein